LLSSGLRIAGGAAGFFVAVRKAFVHRNI